MIVIMIQSVPTPALIIHPVIIGPIVPAITPCDLPNPRPTARDRQPVYQDVENEQAEEKGDAEKAR